MAGSNKWFLYTTDSTTQFAIYRDESNIEAVNGAVGDYPDTGSTVQFALPTNVKARIASYANPTNTIVRNVVCLTPAIFNAIAPGATITDAVSGATLTLRSKRGETIKLPKGADTGLVDGDAT